MKTIMRFFKTVLPIVVTGGCFLFISNDSAPAQAPSPAKPAPPTVAVDPSAHAAHAAAGTHPTATPAPAGKGDPALSQDVVQLQAKIAQLEAALAKNAPPTAAAPAAGAMPGMPAASPAMSGGGRMGRMPAGGSMPAMGGGAAPARGSMSMMGMMDKMMGMMDKMMGMGGGAMPAGSAPMAGDMGDDAMEMAAMGGGGAMPAPAQAAPMAGGGMGMMGMDKMEMAGMMGMAPMAGGASMPQSALPGFPGASHLYHIGATGFFLDHSQHIALTTEQQAALNKAKEQALLAKSTADRAIQQAEQELWTLTAADQPDATAIQEKIAEIGKLTGDERLAFIRAVGEASKLLTDAQRKSLTGFAPPTPAPEAPMAPMKDM